MDIGHLLPAAASPAPETETECVARHAATLRALADAGLRLALRAAARAERAGDEAAAALPPEQAEDRLDTAERSFTRLSGAVRQAVALEQRVRAGRITPERGRRAPARTLFRQAVRDAADDGFSDEAREAMRRAIEDRIEDALIAGPDEQMDVTLLAEVDQDIALALRFRVLANGRLNDLAARCPEGDETNAPEVGPPPW